MIPEPRFLNLGLPNDEQINLPPLGGDGRRVPHRQRPGPLSRGRGRRRMNGRPRARVCGGPASLRTRLSKRPVAGS